MIYALNDKVIVSNGFTKNKAVNGRIIGTSSDTGEYTVFTDGSDGVNWSAIYDLYHARPDHFFIPKSELPDHTLCFWAKEIQIKPIISVGDLAVISVGDHIFSHFQGKTLPIAYIRSSGNYEIYEIAIDSSDIDFGIKVDEDYCEEAGLPSNLIGHSIVWTKLNHIHQIKQQQRSNRRPKNENISNLGRFLSSIDKYNSWEPPAGSPFKFL